MSLQALSRRRVASPPPIPAAKINRFSGGPSGSVAEPVARDSNADSSNIGGAVAADAADGCGAGKGDGPC